VKPGNSLMPETVLENLGLRVSGGWKSRIRYIVVTGVSLNSAATDVATITGLPAKYKVGNVRAFDASISLTTATVDVRDAAGGAGNTTSFRPAASRRARLQPRSRRCRSRRRRRPTT
jgi:hypothetical protein